MSTDKRNIYCFISDSDKKFYRAIQQPDGGYAVSKNTQPYPIVYNPSNLYDSSLEFATNTRYNSLIRTIAYPLEFIKDGAAILRHLYFLWKGTETECYLTIIEWDGYSGTYVLSYYGKFDLMQKSENPKTGMFKVPCVDNTVFALISENDDTEYAIDCSITNPKAIKVLLDGVTLVNRYTYQTFHTGMSPLPGFLIHTIPFSKVNEDGDSFGIITRDQTEALFANYVAIEPENKYSFLTTLYAITGLRISGNFKFSTSQSPAQEVEIAFYTSTGQKHIVYAIPGNSYPAIAGRIYDVAFDFTLNLSANESVYFVASMTNTFSESYEILPEVTNISISTNTKSEPVVAYGLRPLDLVNEIVSKITDNKYSINSSFFTTNNKCVCLSGDSIRGIENSKIYTSFSDFFKSFDSIYFLAMKSVNGDLYIEKYVDIYTQTSTSNIIDIGDCIDLEFHPAEEYFFNEVSVGSPKVDLRHPSGRLEFNSTNTYTLPIKRSKKKLDIVSKYRTGCYDIMFLILDYQGGSTKDNTGDKSVYIVDITDNVSSAVEDIETFEEVTVNNATLSPIIKSPIDNYNLTYNKPVIRGIAPAGSNVNIYVDTVLDGNTTADGSGNWSYNIVTALSSFVFGVTTGVHLIEATFTDLSAPKTSITVFVDTAIPTVENIIYPSQLSSIYNNKPLIKGVAQAGTNIDVSIDGVIVGSVVADNSCIWTFQSPVIPNGNRTISINAGSASVNVTVDSYVSYPLITYIGSELDGFLLVNNLPLVKGVAIPGTQVTLFVDYISLANLGIAVADVNGNWEIQLVPTFYSDPLSGLPVYISPLSNGSHIISTSLVNHTVGINVTGYQLNRPAYSSITGVTDNTVFNTTLSPKRMLLNRAPLFASILRQQQNELIRFQTADKNSNLRTVLGGVVVSENTDVTVSSLGNPVVLLEYANIKTKTNNSFAKTLYDFTNGDVVKFSFRGTEMYALPIGSMKISNIFSDVQEWKLLMSPNTLYSTLLNLYKTGLKITLMQNSLYHSDYNSLHFVTYDFQQNAKYNFKTIYDDWFNSRNDAWALNPSYIQKFQTSETIKDQIITNGLSSLTLRMYRCSDAKLVDTIAYNAVAPTPIQPPDVVLEAIIDFSLYPEDQYFFVLMIDALPVCISERVETREKWDGTILIESSNSINKTGAFFSTGFKTILRVEGLVKKLQPDVVTNIAKEESGNSELLYGDVSRKRTIRFGTAYGLPDYLYLKIADALTMDELQVEGVYYTLGQDEKIEPSDDVDGHPLYYYNVNLVLQTNNKGKVFPGAPGSNIEGVVLVVDATAFGLPPGSLININLE